MILLAVLQDLKLWTSYETFTTVEFLSYDDNGDGIYDIINAVYGGYNLMPNTL